MVFPLLVEHAQHQHALVIAHCVGADEFLLGVVASLQLLENRIAEFLAIQSFGLDTFGENVNAEASEDCFL